MRKLEKDNYQKYKTSVIYGKQQIQSITTSQLSKCAARLRTVSHISGIDYLPEFLTQLLIYANKDISGTIHGVGVGTEPLTNDIGSPTIVMCE
jgi:hypothetical protein